MTLTVKLPNELASYLMRDRSAEESNTVTLDELLEAIKLKEQEADDKIADALLAEYDPHAYPKREEAEVIAIFEEEVAEGNDFSNTITLEEFRQEMDAFWTARQQRSEK